MKPSDKMRKLLGLPYNKETIKIMNWKDGTWSTEEGVDNWEDVDRNEKEIQKGQLLTKYINVIVYGTTKNGKISNCRIYLEEKYETS